MTLNKKAAKGQLTIASDNLEELLLVFPKEWRNGYESLHRCADDLIEFVADLGRIPVARYQRETLKISEHTVTYADLDYIASRVGEFSSDNRAGIDAALHRVSAIRNRQGRIVGITARVGRAVYGDADIIRDVLKSGRSILLLGKPGVGKTTVLREVSRVLSDEFGRRVVIIDTSNEIAGDGDIPHPGVGMARRMQVAHPEQQHKVMIEAVENHTPEVIIIDEISTEDEAYAARTIAERGVMLVATAHGITLENLIQNPTLSDLIGGIESVTLSDEMAFKKGGGHKAILERKAPPTFNVVIELRDRNTFAIHKNVEQSVDAILRGAEIAPMVRVRCQEGDEPFGGDAESENEFESKAGAAKNEAENDNAVPGGRKDKFGKKDASGRDAEGELKPAPALARHGTLIPRRSKVQESSGEDNAEKGAEAENGDKAVSERISRLRQDRYTDGLGNVLLAEADPEAVNISRESVSIYPVGISRSRLERLIGLMDVPAEITSTWKTAGMVLAPEESRRNDPNLFRVLRQHHVPTYFVSENSWPKIKAFLDDHFHSSVLTDGELAKVEAEAAVKEVMESGRPCNLLPQDKALRRMQSQIAAEAGLKATVYGHEPDCYLRFFGA